MVQQKQAFTLIELLVVVLIIGILAAVALPQYRVAVAKSRYATMKNIAKSLVAAEEIFYLANNKYTRDLRELDIDAGGTPIDNKYNQRNYNWGYCAVYTEDGGNDYVFCECNNTGLAYQIHFNKSTHNSNIRRCFARATNKIAKRVCQQETNSVNTITTRENLAYTY